MYSSLLNGPFSLWTGQWRPAGQCVEKEKEGKQHLGPQVGIEPVIPTRCIFYLVSGLPCWTRKLPRINVLIEMNSWIGMQLENLNVLGWWMITYTHLIAYCCVFACVCVLVVCVDSLFARSPQPPLHTLLIFYELQGKNTRGRWGLSARMSEFNLLRDLQHFCLPLERWKKQFQWAIISTRS